jgi:excinuclease ABC subunit C
VPKLFDRKFGASFAASIPLEPGIYRIYAADGVLVYVGKAKNLRRRLSQYRNARRRKAHAKMRAIIADGERIEFDTCEGHLEACLLETRLIQQHRPRWNIAGAFHFLYPMLGMYAPEGFVYFCYTTSPEKFPEFSLHGAYRSREITGDAFFALMELLKRVGHPLPRSQLNSRAGLGGRDRYSYVVGFRRLDERWQSLLSEFWRGRSRAAIAELILALVEKPSARRTPQQIQEAIDLLKRFWKHEASLLRRVTRDTGIATWPVPQQERDLLFLEYRLRREEGRRAAPRSGNLPPLAGL